MEVSGICSLPETEVTGALAEAHKRMHDYSREVQQARDAERYAVEENEKLARSLSYNEGALRDLR